MQLTNDIQKLCIRGNLDDIKKILATDNNIHVKCFRNYGFRLACRYGHLHIVKYVLSLYKTHKNDGSKINLQIKIELGIIWAYSRGHLNIVKYLTRLYKYNSDYNKINILIYKYYFDDNSCNKYLSSIGHNINQNIKIIIL